MNWIKENQGELFVCAIIIMILAFAYAMFYTPQKLKGGVIRRLDQHHSVTQDELIKLREQIEALNFTTDTIRTMLRGLEEIELPNII